MTIRLPQALRWSLVGGLMAGGLAVLLDVVGSGPNPENVSFDQWYGNWREVVLISVVFATFVLGFLRPRRRVEWRGAGVCTAFLLSLFTEMFGIPLTLYLVAPLLGLAPTAFGRDESLLWGFALDRLGALPLPVAAYGLMVVSFGLITVGVSLLALGWAALHQGRGGLVTGGCYGYVRHPQYLGVILIVIGYVIQWPTLLGVVMAPVLVVMYRRLAAREDGELAGRFGILYVAYTRG